MSYVTLVPAYGRDYKSAKAVKADWKAGKDFIIADLFHPYDTKPINKEDADRTPARYSIRFDSLRKSCNV